MNTPSTDISEISPRANSLPNAMGGADPWVGLQKYTSARIGIGRAGGSQRTPSILDFRLAHARARDAVHAQFFPERVAEKLEKAGFESVVLRTMVSDKRTYLMNPDAGRRLCKESRAALAELAPKWGRRDLAVVISDGLSATAAKAHAADTAIALFKFLPKANWSAYPVFIVPYARVKIQDDINETLGARHTIILVGERPGLGSPDSLSAYFTYRSKWESVESDRNCISNIRPSGMPIELAARKLSMLMEEPRVCGISGTALKDDIDMSALESASNAALSG